MARYAEIRDDVVVQFIDLPSDVTIEKAVPPELLSFLVKATPKAEIGWTYDGGKFAAPVAVELPPSPVPPQLSFLQFMDLFTGQEQLAIAGAAMTDAPTKLWYDRAVGAQFIDLGDARLAAGLQALVDAGLLTAPRRDQVLTGLPPE